MNTESRNRRNQYFVPGEGIAREVITADICKYLDNDATVRPGDYQGRPGFYIYAYRNLTTEMITDLKADSIRWEQEKAEKARARAARPAGAGGMYKGRGSAPLQSPETGVERYTDSRTHESRQLQGPSVRKTPSPGAQNYPPGRQVPPPQDYRPPGAGNYGPDSQYTMHASNNYVPAPRSGYSGNYPPEQDSGYPGSYVPPPPPPPSQGQEFRGPPPPGYDYHSRFTQESGYDYSNQSRQAQHPANVGRQFVPQTSGAPPQQSESFYSDPRAGPRQDHRMDTRPYSDDRDPYYSDGRRRT